MPTLTCVTCSVMFATVDLQKQHYKSDWHQYNLKRKVASLDPIPVDQFEHLCALMKKENNDADRIYCNVCKKSFRSKQTFENHLQSKKHVDLLQCSTENEDQVNVGVPSNKTTKVISKEPEIETDSEIEEVSSDEWDEVVSYNNPALKNNCLFCQHHSASLTKSIKHMSVTHSFFIPDVEYVADLKGLLLYLGEKICQGFMCIWCNDKKSGFISMEAAQSHMRDKGHTKMLYNSETMQEYLEFYYFDEDDINLLNKSPSDLNQTNDENEEECMMVLPSGQTIGHRSLASFYRYVSHIIYILIEMSLLLFQHLLNV